jgi:preprotein translocase subunit SecA
MNETGRPVLVGTISIEKSEELAEKLERAGVEFKVLNAKQHEREAAIIAQAGRPSAVTIATNMAGRGVDILLGGNPAGLADDFLHEQGVDRTTATPEQIEAAVARANEICARDKQSVVGLGGLHILGTERHEARRIDNQLRGRAGRQGDPGSSRFFVSLQDDLMKRFGGSSIAGLMDKLGLEEDVPLEHRWVNKAIENAQTKVEAFNFDIRKHVVEYDDVMNLQREVIYDDRRKILKDENLRPMIEAWATEEINSLVATHLAGEDTHAWDYDALYLDFGRLIPLPEDVTADTLAEYGREELPELITELMTTIYERLTNLLPPEIMRNVEREWMIRVIDHHWINHLTAIDDVREGIGLRAYGQRDPLVEYKMEAASMFDELLAAIRHDVVQVIYHLTPRVEPVQQQRPRPMTTNREEENGQQPVKVAKKVGRNDPCPCGKLTPDGKRVVKYKQCHGR